MAEATPGSVAAARAVPGRINFLGPMNARPRYHANDAGRDVLNLEPHTVQIGDARHCAPAPTLEREGFAVFNRSSGVKDFRDASEIGRVYVPEIRRQLLDVTGADEVMVSPRGILRFAERSPDCGALDNSRPARFVHIDVSDATAADFTRRSLPKQLPAVRRAAHYNAWRVLTPPPQDVPLAVCDARTVFPADLVPADAVFDAPDRPEWSFEGLLLRYSEAQRWWYYADMTPAELLVFKTNDTDPHAPHHVPHCAFDDPGCPEGVPPRCSIEMRGIAYWYQSRAQTDARDRL